MPLTLKVGTVLIEDRPMLKQFLGLECEPCSGNWSVVKAFDGFALDRKIHAVGWNFFFMAGEVKVMFIGALATTKIQSALKRVLAKVREQNFNALEVTEITAKRFLGVPYVIVSAHSRHIQQSCHLNGVGERRAYQHDAEWPRS